MAVYICIRNFKSYRFWHTGMMISTGLPYLTSILEGFMFGFMYSFEFYQEIGLDILQDININIFEDFIDVLSFTKGMDSLWYFEGTS